MKPYFTVVFLLVYLNVELQSQCSTQPCQVPMPTNDASQACILPGPQALDCYQGQMTNDPPVSFPPFWCSTIENNQWFAFVADANTISFEIATGACTSGSGIQAAVLSTSDCVNFDFVSPCVGGIPTGTSQTVTATGLNPGEVYYLMFDGSAGAICEYSINGTSGLISPPTQACLPSSSVLTYNSTTISNWTISPPGIGVIQGNPVADQIVVEWLAPGTAQVCAQNISCPNADPICVEVTIGQEAQSTENAILCQGETVVCAGQTYSAPGVYQTSFTSSNGCDSVVTCFVDLVPIVTTPPQQVEICGPGQYQVCDIFVVFSGIFTQTCDGYLGCDSTVTIDLAILEPVANIALLAELGCGLDSTTILDGSGSSFNVNIGGTTEWLWTGPGIVGSNSDILAVIDQPGTYCLEVIHGRNGTTCSDQVCIDVEQNFDLPALPNLNGPDEVCDGDLENYTVTPQGNVPPTGYTWTTPNGESFTVVNGTTISVDWSGSAGGELCVTADNDCGSSPPACITVDVTSMPGQPTISGPATVCTGATGQAYSISPAMPGTTYAWTVSGGAAFSGSGNTILVNFANASGNVQICATSANDCGESMPGCVDIPITGLPDMPVLSGPTNVCQNESGVVYEVTDPEPGVTYNWTVPTGATVSGTGTSVTVDFGSPSGQVCVTATGSCGNSPASCQPVTVAPSPTATIGGSGEFCEGSGDTVALTVTLTGSSPWELIYDDGAAQQQITILTSPYLLPATQAGTYTLVSVTDATNCPGTVNGTATVTENPLPTAVLSGSGTICQGSGQQAQLTIMLTGAAPWTVNWESGAGPQSPLIINGSPFTLPVGQGQAGTITCTGVTDANGCTGTASGSAEVEVFVAPTVNNVGFACDATNTSFTVTFNINGGDPATYSVTPAEGTISGNTFTSDPIPAGGGYSFVVTDANNCNPVTVSDDLVICNCTTAAGDMDQTPIQACGAGMVTGTYDDSGQVFDGNDVLVFILHGGSSVNISPPVISTSGSPEVTFDPATMSFGTTYYLSAVVGDDDGTGSIDLDDPCLDVAQGTPIVFYQIPTATLAGGSEICQGETTMLEISLSGVAPWSVTINNQNLNITNSPFSYSVTPSVSTTYILTNVQDEHCSNVVSDSTAVTVNLAPTVSNVQTDCNQTGTAYEVCFEINGGDTTCYQVTPATGNLTGNVFCSDPIPGGQGYSFEVTDCHGCPVVTVEDDIVDCNCLTEVGDMATGILNLCGQALAQPVYLGGEMLDPDDVLCFVLHEGDPAQPLATNPTGEFPFDPVTMNFGQTYFVCPVAGNDDGSGCVDFSDPCLSIGACANVVFHALPTATLDGGTAICGGEDATLSLTLTGQAPWTVVYQDDMGNPTSLAVLNSPFDIDVNPAVTTGYTLVSVEDAQCNGSVDGTATVTVNQAPQVENVLTPCDASATFYTVTFDIVGGNPGSYAVSPSGTLNGNAFGSDPIPSGQPFTFQVDDANGCGPVTVSGTQECNCETDAGTMPAAAVEFCVDETATVGLTSGEILDGDDVLVYILHNESGAVAGTILATNTAPEFNFLPGMTAGETYYISAVAGNDDGSGGVDYSDACLDVAPGTPVSFNELPTAGISGQASLCEDESAEVTFSLTGEGPFFVTYSLDGVVQPPVEVPAPGDFQLTISPANTLEVSLVSVQDAGTGCDNDANGSVTLAVFAQPEAGAQAGELEFCAGDTELLALFDQLDGADPGGLWNWPDGTPIPDGNLDIAGLPPGNFTYTYTVSGPAASPCPDDEATLELTIHLKPNANAGPDQEISCGETEVTLGGTGTTSGATYSWTGTGSVSDPTITQPTTSESGTYTLTVTTQEGCTDSDETIVTKAGDIPQPHISISDVTCFGNQDGFIVIDSITDGQPPYLCSFDGSPFTGLKQFTGLGPGPHSLVIQDAGGCETTLNFNIQEPQEVTVVIDASFEGNENIANLGEPFVLEIITTPPFGELDTVIWTPSDLVPCDSCQTNTVSLQTVATFTVVVAKDGCSDEDDLTIFVKKDYPLYVPNAFSPNDDGINDLLQVYGGAVVSKVKSFLVFSRWGETVFEYYNFELGDPAFGWDGEYRQEPLDPAVFTWFAEVEFLDGKVEVFKGDVSLVR